MDFTSALNRARTILIVEEPPEISEQVKRALTGEGYRIITASDVASAIEQIITEKPEMLIVGIALPTTFGLLQQLDNDSSMPRLPVIAVLKWRAADADVRKGWESGIDAYMGVPFRSLELKAFVKRIFKSLDEPEDSKKTYTV